jgi:hypothetical protein
VCALAYTTKTGAADPIAAKWQQMLVLPRTITNQYNTKTAMLLSRERVLWMYRVEIARLEKAALEGEDVHDLLVVMRARARTLEATQELEWACERATGA